MERENTLHPRTSKCPMSGAQRINRGISLRALDALWLAAGGRIVRVGMSSELRYVAPSGALSYAYTSQRKDAPLKLVMIVRKHLNHLLNQEHTMYHETRPYAGIRSGHGAVPAAQTTSGYTSPVERDKEPIPVVHRLAKNLEEANGVATDIRNRLATFNERAFGPRPGLAQASMGDQRYETLAPPKNPGQLGDLQDHLSSLLATLYTLSEEVNRAEEIL